jgi:hypothetical protein
VRLQLCEGERGFERRRIEDALLHAFDGAAGMLDNGNDLEAERQHVRRQPRLDDRFRVDIVLFKMAQRAVGGNPRQRRGSANSSPRWRRRVKAPCSIPPE